MENGGDHSSGSTALNAVRDMATMTQMEDVQLVHPVAAARATETLVGRCRVWATLQLPSKQIRVPVAIVQEL